MLFSKSVQCIIKTTVNLQLKKKSVQSSNLILLRPFRGKSYGQNNKIFEISEIQQGLKKKYGPMEIGQLAAAGGAALGLGALCFYGMGLANEPGAIDRMFVWPQYIKTRIRDTYMYFGASVAVTAGSAITVFRSPFGAKFFNFCSRHPIMSTVGIIAGLIGTGQVMMSIPYSPGLSTKQLMWMLNCGVIGLAIAPVGIFGGALAIRAAWYTGGIIGGLSGVAMCAPSEKFLSWGGPLGIGLGGVLVASLGSAFLPPTAKLGLTLYSISLYGGLLLFSGFLLYDTQKIIRYAESHPMYAMQPYDPINASHRILMDTVNIFVRIIQILAMGGGSKKR